VEGHVTGFGNPDWLSTHDPAPRTAAAVSLVVSQGATCVGKTVVDELSYRLAIFKAVLHSSFAKCNHLGCKITYRLINQLKFSH
jgi:hypothetical protein